MNTDEGDGRRSEGEIARRRFRFSIGNLMLIMVPLGLMFVGLGYGYREQSKGVFVVVLGLGMPMVVGALVRGGRGLFVGFLVGMLAVCFWPACVLLVVICGVWHEMRWAAGVEEIGADLASVSDRGDADERG